MKTEILFELNIAQFVFFVVVYVETSPLVYLCVFLEWDC